MEPKKKSMPNMMITYRMSYVDAIAWLKEHDYKKEDGTFYEIG